MKNNPNIPENELVQQCIAGNRKFQEVLYKKHASKMYGICLSYIKDRDDAKDVLQNGFIKVFASLKQFNGGSLEGWIRSIIVRTAIDHYRILIRDQRNVSIEDAHAMPFDASISDKIHEKELLALIQRLPEGARVIFNLYAIEGYDHNEIAEMLGISNGTSKSQFSRAKVLLQNWIGKLYSNKKDSDIDNNENDKREVQRLV